jgi:hypothetical protein
MSKHKYIVEGQQDFLRFASVGAMVAFVDGTDADRMDNSCNAASFRHHKDGGGDWFNGYNVERCKQELVAPPACKADVAKLASEIETEHEFNITRRRLVNRREDGDELDAVAWVRRETDGWSRMEKTATARKVIRLAVNVSVNCGRRPADLYYRGAAAAALADCLERAGHSVEITAFFCASRFYKQPPKGLQQSILEVTVKHADQNMDMGAVALVLSEIGFFRSMILAAAAAGAAHEMTGCMGYSCELPDKVSGQYDVVFDEGILNYADALATVKKYAAGFQA